MSAVKTGQKKIKKSKKKKAKYAHEEISDPCADWGLLMKNLETIENIRDKEQA